MRRNRTFVISLILLIITVCLSSCSSKKSIQEVRLSIENDSPMTMAVCWSEDSPYGIYLSRVVNNYNLNTENNPRIKLLFYKNEKDYLADLRLQTATRSLPDLFIVNDNENDVFLKNTSKIMALHVTDAHDKSGNRIADVALQNSNGDVVGYYIGQPEIEIFVRKGILPDGMVFDDEASAIEYLINGTGYESEMPASAAALEDANNNDQSIDYLAILLNTSEKDIPLNKVFEIWKSSMPFFMTDDAAIGSTRQEPLIILNQSGWYDISNEDYDPISQFTGRNYKFLGNKYYLAAAADKEQSRENAVNSFIDFALRYLNYPYDDPTEGTECRLQTKDLSVMDFEKIQNTLMLYFSNLVEDAGLERVKDYLVQE